MKNIWIITKEDFKNLILNPLWVFFATGFPILMVTILGYLTKNSYGKKVTSYDYYGISIMIYMIINSGMISANAFMEERIKKPNMRIIYAPGFAQSIFISKILASFAFGFIFHFIDSVFLVLVFNVKFEYPFQLFCMLSLLELFSNMLGVMLCCVVKKESITNQIQGIIINLFALLGGLLFPLDGYGKVVRLISLLCPVKWVMNVSFQMIYDSNTTLLPQVILILIVCIGIMAAICNVTFRKEDCIC